MRRRAHWMIELKAAGRERRRGHVGRNLTTHSTEAEIARLSFDNLKAWLDSSRSVNSGVRLLIFCMVYKPTHEEVNAFLLGMYLLDWQVGRTGFAEYNNGEICLNDLLSRFFGEQLILLELSKNNYEVTFSNIEAEFLKSNRNRLALAFKSGWATMLLFELSTIRSIKDAPELWALCRVLRIDEQTLSELEEAIQDNGFIVGEFWYNWQAIIMREMSTKGYAFLCHAHEDKEKIRELQRRLHSFGFRTWLDEDNILPGKNWDEEIRKALKNAEVVLVLLSNTTITKRGYVQNEIKFALDVIGEIPEEDVYIIPVLLEECAIPQRLAKYQAVRLYLQRGFDMLIASLNYQMRGVGKAT